MATMVRGLVVVTMMMSKVRHLVGSSNTARVTVATRKGRGLPNSPYWDSTTFLKSVNRLVCSESNRPQP